MGVLERVTVLGSDADTVNPGKGNRSQPTSRSSRGTPNGTHLREAIIYSDDGRMVRLDL